MCSWESGEPQNLGFRTWGTPKFGAREPQKCGILEGEPQNLKGGGAKTGFWEKGPQNLKGENPNCGFWEGKVPKMWILGKESPQNTDFGRVVALGLLKLMRFLTKILDFSIGSVGSGAMPTLQVRFDPFWNILGILNHFWAKKKNGGGGFFPNAQKLQFLKTSMK